MINNLKELVEKEKTTRGVTQVDLAKEMGVDPATFSRYINGHMGSVRFDILQTICDYFKLPSEKIIRIVPDGYEEEPA